MEINPLENFYHSKPELQRESLLFLRRTILETDSNITEGISYGTAFFYAYGKTLCYFHYGKMGFYIGFTKGNKLKERKGFYAGERTVVKILPMDLEKTLNTRLLKNVLTEALRLNKKVVSTV
jgi:hypothetical protein